MNRKKKSILDMEYHLKRTHRGRRLKHIIEVKEVITKTLLHTLSVSNSRKIPFRNSTASPVSSTLCKIMYMKVNTSYHLKVLQEI